MEALAQTVRSRAGAMPAGDLRVLVSDDLARARELHHHARERLTPQVFGVEANNQGLRDMILMGAKAYASYLEKQARETVRAAIVREVLGLSYESVLETDGLIGDEGIYVTIDRLFGGKLTVSLVDFTEGKPTRTRPTLKSF